MTRECPKCHGSGEVDIPYFNLYGDLFTQTPREVWDEYRANGYTMAQAIREEMSYA